MAPDTHTRDQGPPLRTALLELWPYAIGLAAVFALLLSRDSISRHGSHFGRMALAGGALLLLHLLWRAHELDPSLGLAMRSSADGPRRVAARLLLAAWVGAAGFGVFNYYQFDSKVSGTVDDYADATYYYLNSKYFEELGYTKLYRAMLIADNEGPKRFAHVRRFRDLVDYEKELPLRAAFVDTEDVKSSFSPERWQAFKGDLEFITQQQARGGWRYFFIDHGYNPPPPWTLVGGTLSQLTAVEHMKRITSVDMALVALMLLAIAWVANPATMLVALVFYCVTFSGRWPILGHAILRFDWLVALVGATLALRRGRTGWAGALLMYATVVRIFPGIFALPYVVVLVRDILRERAVSVAHRNFIIGAVACLLLVGGGALVRYGPDAYQESIHNLSLHSSPESFSSHRVGLGDVLMYRGEWSKKDFRRSGGATAKREQLWELHPYIKIGGLLVIAILCLHVWRSREPIHRLLWLGVYPLFVLTNPQINYYNLRLLLVLLHMERWTEYRHKLGLYMLFGIEVLTQAAYVAGAARYAVTNVTSHGMLIYLLTMAGFIARDYIVGEATPQKDASGPEPDSDTGPDAEPEPDAEPDPDSAAQSEADAPAATC